MVHHRRGEWADEQLSAQRRPEPHHPGKIANFHNNADTFRPYDASKAIGDTAPTTPRPPKKAAGCGVFGQILLAAVAVAVTALTATTIGVVPAAVLGSVVSQGVGLATGIQDKFSYKAVALAAITAGVGQGLDKLSILAGSSTAAVAGQAALANTITQGVAVATGLQKRFDFAGVAVAGIVAGTISAVSRRLPGAGQAATKTTSAVRPTILNQTLSGTAALIAGAGARSIVTGTSFGDNITAALPDAIGATIGNAVAGRLTSKQSPAEKALIDKARQSAQAGAGDRAGDAALQRTADAEAERTQQQGAVLRQQGRSQGNIQFADSGEASLIDRAQRFVTRTLDFNGDGKIGIISDATAAIAQTREAIEDNTITVTADRLFRPANDALVNLRNAITGGLNRVGIGISRDAISFGGVKGAVFSRDVVSFGGAKGAVFSRDGVSFGGRLGLVATKQSLSVGGIGITTDGRGFIGGGGSVGGGGASASFATNGSALTTGGLRAVGGANALSTLQLTPPELAQVTINQNAGRARERLVAAELRAQFPNASVQGERLLRDANGNKLIDKLSEEGRRIDLAVIENGKVLKLVEVTSLTANKTTQELKELNIRKQNKDVFIRDRITQELINVNSVKTETYRRN